MHKWKSWGAFYENVVGSKRLLEGNIMEHGRFVEELARHVVGGDKALEVGSGAGVMGAPLVGGGVEVTSLDNDEHILEMCEVNARVLGVSIKYLFGDALDLPFGDRSFRLAFSLGLLEHFSDAEIDQVVGEQLRVARTVVAGMPVEASPQGVFGNERWFPAEWWVEKLGRFGVVKSFLYGTYPLVCVTLDGGRG